MPRAVKSRGPLYKESRLRNSSTSVRKHCCIPARKHHFVQERKKHVANANNVCQKGEMYFLMNFERKKRSRRREPFFFDEE